MPQKLIWSEPRDTQLKRLRKEGCSWDSIANELGVSRNAAIERGRRIGARLPPLEHVTPGEDPDRPPLPAGHCVSWAILNVGTCLEGVPYGGTVSGLDAKLRGGQTHEREQLLAAE